MKFRKFYFVLISVIIVVCIAAKEDINHTSVNSSFRSENLLASILQQVNDLRNSVKNLNDSLATHPDLDSVKFHQQWKVCREKLRLVSAFLHYYRPDLAQLVNGPPVFLPVEEDEVGGLYPPHGFQVVEQLWFRDTSSSRILLLRNELKKTDQSLAQFAALIQNSTLVEQDFWEALEKEMLRYFLLTVTQMETPESKLAFSEGAHLMISLPEMISSCYPEAAEEELVLSANIRASATSCASYLLKMEQQENPDYFALYTQYYVPLSEAMSRMMYQRLPDFDFQNGPVNFLSRSIFDAGAFHVNNFLSGGRLASSPLRASLGRLLFFDPALSDKNDRSCASCHQPGKAFSDGLPKSIGAQHGLPLLRNAPTLINAVMQRKLFHDGRAFTFENQASEVLNNPDEMQTNFSVVPEKIMQSSEYIALFKSAFEGSDDTAISNASILKAIAAYEETLLALNSRFDQAIRGDLEMMSDEEKAGFNLFMGKAECATCHFLPLFNGTAPPDYIESEMEVLGVPGNSDTLHPVLDQDPGREKIIPMKEYHGAFKTPTVRNGAITGPYMHNGVFSSLDAVVEFYNKGGGQGIGLNIVNQSLNTSSLHLTEKEKEELVTFLLCLTDTVGCTEIPLFLPVFDLSNDMRVRKP